MTTQSTIENTKQKFMPGIFNSEGYEFVYNPDDKEIYALSNGSKILIEDLNDELFFIDLDEEILSNRFFQKEIEGKNFSQKQKRRLFIHCFLCGYDGSLDYEGSTFQYDMNKFCEERDNCPYGKMCEKAILVEGVKISHKEHQIIKLVAKEKKNTAIASDLNNAVLTTTTQLSNLYNKIGVKSRVGLVDFAHRNNLI